jgi:hypothetical protein
MQGIIVHEDDDRFLRFGTYFDSGAHQVFAAFISAEGAITLVDGSVATQRSLLRVERTGDVWTYSTAGEDEELEVAAEFEQALIVTEAGFYAGNPGGGAPFLASFDYFQNLDDPIDDTDERIIDIPDPPPPVEFWLGNEQQFGPGLGQTWINVVGKVYDEDGVAGVTYSLNGGEALETPVGADGFRLFADGDFNIELDPTELMVGDNTVEVTMEDEGGETVTETLALAYDDGAGPTLPFTADWTSASQISDFGQVVDGHWELTADGVHTVEPGYDRLITIGDYQTWGPHMEVTATFTLHDHIETGDLSGIGLAFGWQGHEGDATPKLEWPLQGLCWVRGFPWDPQFQIITYPEQIRAQDARSDIALDTEYTLKARSEPAGAGMSRIQAKLWASGESEPAGWQLTADVEERAGSILLVSHLVDVTWGEVDIQPVP